VLELNQLQIQKDGEALLAFDEVVKPGEILTVMGASGIGKSTLLSCIVGQLHESFTFKGTIVLNGKDVTQVPTEKRKIGMMFQSPLLFPHMTVSENVKFGAPILSLQVRDECDAMLEGLGLSELSDRMPNTLSGGQQSRVALARLLVSKPQAVLLDEPFSSLDESNKTSTRELFVKHLEATRVPVVLVTHDESEAKALGSRIVRLDKPC
jgi:putative thiamine transport system ATP-binding protein